MIPWDLPCQAALVQGLRDAWYAKAALQAGLLQLPLDPFSDVPSTTDATGPACFYGLLKDAQRVKSVAGQNQASKHG